MSNLPARNDSTAASMPSIYTVRVTPVSEKTGKTEIQNISGKTIFLIPINISDEGTAQSIGQLDTTTKPKEIKVKESRPMKWDDYKGIRPDCKVQRYILFRAAYGVNFQYYIDTLNRKGVKLTRGDKPLLCSNLKGSLRLECGEVVDGNAGKVAEEGKQEALEKLADKIQEVLDRQKGLEKGIKVLLDKMEILETAWKSFDQNQKKKH